MRSFPLLMLTALTAWITSAPLSPSAAADPDAAWLNRVAAEWVDDPADLEPYWLARSSYTAELDLSRGVLTVLPLDGDDVQVNARIQESGQTCDTALAIDAGVYLLTHTADGELSLQPSYGVGTRTEFDHGARALVGCEQARAGVIALPEQALQALLTHHVGAVYLHY